MTDQVSSRRTGPDTRRIGSGMSIVLVGPLTSGWENLDRCLQSMEDETVYRCQEDAAQIIELCNAAAPCVLLLNLRFLEALKGLRILTLVDGSDSVDTLVLAETEDLPICRKVLLMGCKGLLVPNMPMEMNVRAIAKVREGEIWMSRTKLSALLQENVRVNDDVKLTSREKEILCLVGRGMNNQQIADALYITRETVRWHIRGLNSKIGTHNRQSVASYGALFYSVSACGEGGFPGLSKTAFRR